MSSDLEVANHSGMREPSQESNGVRAGTDRLWRLSLCYVGAHPIAIIVCAWFAYVDSTSTGGTLYRVATYVASPAIAIMFVAPFLTVAMGMLSWWRGWKFLALAVCEGALSGLHFLVMLPTYSWGN